MDTNENSLICKRKGKILYLTLNRPDRGNSLDVPLTLKLRQVFIDAQQNPKVRVIHLTGAGSKNFCTGMDVKTGVKLSLKGKINLSELAGDIGTLIFDGKPTVVAINGNLFGMGIIFSSAADYRIAKSGVTMNMPEIDVGIFPGGTGIPNLVRTCGLPWTRRILLLAEVHDTKNMMKANLIDEVVSDNQLFERSKVIARNLAKKNPVLAKMIKKSINSAYEMKFNETRKLEYKYSDYYDWDDVPHTLQEIETDFGLKIKLRGNPDEIEEEWMKIVS